MKKLSITFMTASPTPLELELNHYLQSDQTKGGYRKIPPSEKYFGKIPPLTSKPADPTPSRLYIRGIT